MKVFVIAFACEPGKTSEPGVGWNLSGELAKRHEITVLTRCNNRESIEAYIATNPESPHGKIRWEYYDLAEWFHKLKKKIPCGIQLYQEIWQYCAARRYKTEFAKYDIVHHLTFGSIFFTPWAARYTDKLVWGPIGGASGAMEDSFLKNESIRSQISEILYRLVTWYSFHPVPWVSGLRKKCCAVLFRTSELAATAKHMPGQATATILETAYAGKILPRQYIPRRHHLRIMSVGRLIPLKGTKYTIQAFAKFVESGGEGELHIYGDGPLRYELENLAAALSTNNQRLRTTIFFHGKVPNSEILEALDSSDILIHSSFREGGSWTILEAMVHGLPVICQNRAGMKDMVSEKCGVKVHATTPDELVDGIADAIGRYYAHPELIRLHGEAGQERVRCKYSWPVCSEIMDGIFTMLNNNRSNERLKGNGK